MARNGSGTFNRLVAGYTAGTTIVSDDVDSEMDDIATALSNSLAKDGQTTATASIPFASGLKTNTIDENTAGSGVTVDSVLLKDGAVNADTINESTPAAGVTIDGLLIKDGAANMDTLSELTPATGVTVDGVLLKDSEVTTDVINEKTPGSGVTIDGLLIKDGAIGSGVISQGKHTQWIPATAMVSRTTNGPSSGSVETTTNKVMISTLDFHQSTQEYAQFQVGMLKSWDEGTVTVIPYWSHAAATAFIVIWECQAVAVSNDGALDAAFGTAQTSTDTGGTTDDIYIAPETSAITVGGTPAENDYVVFQISRKAADGGDTLDADARLHGVKLLYTINAGDDT